MSKAVFLDRDGVINVDRGYVYRSEDFEFIGGVFDACKLFVAAGYRLIVVTNQSGIARGLYSEQDFQSLNQWMTAQFNAQGIHLDAVYFCPHHPEHGQGQYRQRCNCRKPQPGMLLQGIADFELDPAQCIMFGDKTSDLEAAHAAGIGRRVFIDPERRSSKGIAAVPLADQVWRSIAEADQGFLAS